MIDVLLCLLFDCIVLAVWAGVVLVRFIAHHFEITIYFLTFILSLALRIDVREKAASLILPLLARLAGIFRLIKKPWQIFRTLPGKTQLIVMVVTLGCIPPTLYLWEVEWQPWFRGLWWAIKDWEKQPSGICAHYLKWSTFDDLGQDAQMKYRSCQGEELGARMVRKVRPYCNLFSVVTIFAIMITLILFLVFRDYHRTAGSNNYATTSMSRVSIEADKTSSTSSKEVRDLLPLERIDRDFELSQSLRKEYETRLAAVEERAKAEAIIAKYEHDTEMSTLREASKAAEIKAQEERDWEISAMEAKSRKADLKAEKLLEEQKSLRNNQKMITHDLVTSRKSENSFKAQAQSLLQGFYCQSKDRRMTFLQGISVLDILENPDQMEEARQIELAELRLKLQQMESLKDAMVECATEWEEKFRQSSSGAACRALEKKLAVEVSKASSIEATNVGLKKKVDRAEADARSAKVENETLKSQLAQAEQSASFAEATSEKLVHQLSQTKTDSASEQSKRGEVEEQLIQALGFIKTLEESGANLARDFDLLRSQHENLMQQDLHLNSKNTSLESDNRNLQQALFTERYRSGELERKNTALQKIVEDLQSQTFQCQAGHQSRIHDLEKRLAEAATKNDALEGTNELYEVWEKEQAAKLVEAENSAEVYKNEAKGLEEKTRNLEKELRSAKQRQKRQAGLDPNVVKDLTAEVKKLKVNLDKLQSEQQQQCEAESRPDTARKVPALDSNQSHPRVMGSQDRPQAKPKSRQREPAPKPSIRNLLDQLNGLKVQWEGKKKQHEEQRDAREPFVLGGFEIDYLRNIIDDLSEGLPMALDSETSGVRRLVKGSLGSLFWLSTSLPELTNDHRKVQLVLDLQQLIDLTCPGMGN